MPKRKIKWTDGDVFAVPMCDGSFAIGQVLDLMMVNQVRVALYDEVFPSLKAIDLAVCCQPERLISLVASSREQLDYGVWKIFGSRPVTIPIDKRPNEQFRDQEWVGAVHYGSSLIEKFLEAFHSLRPWDQWFNPNFLDEFLISPEKKPRNLIFIKADLVGGILPLQ